MQMIDEGQLLDIVDLIKSGKMVLFLGAGSTKYCKKPDGTPGVTGQGLPNSYLFPAQSWTRHG
jgi:hypothetical protein